MLRKVRIVVSVLTLIILTFYILDFAGLMPVWFGLLAKVQFIPALLSLNLAVLVTLLVATFVFGRIYCSSLCPLGVFQDVVTRLSRIINKKKRFRFRKALTLMRWSFVALAVVAFMGGITVLVGLLDPYSIYSRFAVHILKPAYQAGNNMAEVIFTQFGNQTFYKVSIYLLSVVSLITTIVTTAFVGYLAWVNGRIYCNSICPVGTVLGAISRFSLFKIRIDENSCNSCGSCARNCKASCINAKEHNIDYSQCINCFDCLEVCSQNAMKFSYSFHIPLKNRKKVVNASRRRFMMAVGVSGVAATNLLAAKLPLTDKATVTRKSPITPPGSQSVEHLLQKCTSCHLCVSKCPSNIIKPSFLEYGVGGMFQPTITFANDFCNYDCTICSDV
ncbi:MAG: 4Fe-4S binding protein, partial [Paludibacter sp.]